MAELEARGEFLTTVDHVSLSRREHDVAVMSAGGMAAGEIAERLLVPTSAVDDLLARACVKLGVEGVSGLRAALEGRGRGRPCRWDGVNRRRFLAPSRSFEIVSTLVLRA